MGTVGILNVGAGDTKLTFDKGNPVECARAARIVADMLKRGYALLVQVGERDGQPLYQRAHAFDAETCEYVIAGGLDEQVDIGTDEQEPAPAPKAGRKGAPRKTRRVAAQSTRAIAVGRTAGG